MSAFVRLQTILPQHLISRAAGGLAASEARWVRGPLIRAFAKAYDVDMAQAERPDLADYRSFNDFFSRALAPDARPIDPAPGAVVSPADGVVSQTGIIEEGQLLQAKGIRYSFQALADVCARPEFEGGPFATVYLSPSDYHRVHLPLAGRLVRTVAIPGKLFSVNAATEAGVEGLFAVNERLVMEFETAYGPMLVVMVGAMIVASIETVWDGPASPYRERTVTEHDLAFETGAEIGRFLLGSSVVLAFERGRVDLDASLAAGTVVRMGEAIGAAR
ncbi:archaetidylserine decarboxylase [Rubrivirga sp. IMCC43871]|uniref:archaetidylserine decarboxylase n=1 Tax=Rubrivirga sp. IMCC43871 TaxID=3391575 RepID=UPI00398F9E2A